jgi:hypothetical protein
VEKMIDKRNKSPTLGNGTNCRKTRGRERNKQTNKTEGTYLLPNPIKQDEESIGTKAREY